MDLLFKEDAYLKNCTATVVSAEPGAIRLDRTVFEDVKELGQRVVQGDAVTELVQRLLEIRREIEGAADPP